MADTRVKLGTIELKNPIIPASGTCGYGWEYMENCGLAHVGAIAVKGTTVEPRYGNPLPRIAETPSGMLNSVGLQNPGLEKVISEELPRLRAAGDLPVFMNISGFSVEEYITLAEAFDREDSVTALEVNISCPNVHGGGAAFGTDAALAARVTAAVRKATKKPVFMKLSPNVTDITEIAKACEAEGADGLSLINTLTAMRIDIKKRKPVLANLTGGLSGPAIFPVALRMVWQVAGAVEIPVIGMGGISSAEDVLEMVMAGAWAVEVGAAGLVNPTAWKDMAVRLPELMNELGISSLMEIRGIA